MLLSFRIRFLLVFCTKSFFCAKAAAGQPGCSHFAFIFSMFSEKTTLCQGSLRNLTNIQSDLHFIRRDCIKRCNILSFAICVRGSPIIAAGSSMFSARTAYFCRIVLKICIIRIFTAKIADRMLRLSFHALKVAGGDIVRQPDAVVRLKKIRAVAVHIACTDTQYNWLAVPLPDLPGRLRIRGEMHLLP